MKPEAALHLSKIFKAVADPNRQRIMFLLREKGELSVGDIAAALNLTQPATSQHLRVLKEAEALLSRKSGLQMYYCLCSERLCDAVGDFVQVYQEEVTKAKERASKNNA
jgi:ArsR family transcriptional regulator, arsenate/arsenite/antimonite-responsive transcriptional repressor